MPLQIPQLDDRDFKALIEEATARIPVHTPEWNNFNDSDPGMTLLHVFAFMNENLLYRSNRMPEATRLKFMSLLGIGLQPATAGRGLIVIKNERGPLRATTLLAGAEVLAGNIPFRTLNDVNVLPVSVALFYKRPNNTLDPETVQQYRDIYETFLEEPEDDFTFYETGTFEEPEIGKPLSKLDLSDRVNGTIDGSLWMALLARPGGDVELAVDDARRAIAGQILSIGIYPTEEQEQRVLAAEVNEIGVVDDPRLVFEVAAPDMSLTSLSPAKYERLVIEYAEDVLSKPGIVNIQLPEYEKLNIWEFSPTEEGTGDYPPLLEDRDLAARIVTWIRISVPKNEAESEKTRKEAVLSWVGINTTRIIQAIPVSNERLGLGSGAPNQIYQVSNTPIIVAPVGVESTETAFVLEVKNDRDEWETWNRTDDLYAAKPGEHVYFLDPESGQLRFGDGLRGKRPGFKQLIRVSYSHGGGEAGNVNIGAINKSAALPGGYKVKNPVKTWGASRAESSAEGEQRIPNVIRHNNRLVTQEDFKSITRSTPGVNIARVEILPQFNPDSVIEGQAIPPWPGAVTIMLVRDHDIKETVPPLPDRQFLEAVCRHITPRRLVTTEIYVRGPEYIPIWVSVGIVVMPGQVRSIVERDVKDAIREYLSPLKGGPRKVQADGTVIGGDGWPLSMEIRQQDLEAVAVRVPGVRYVPGVILGIDGGGTLIVPKTTVRIRGLELPWLMNVLVSDGEPEPLSNFSSGETGSSRIPVPTVPQNC